MREIESLTRLCSSVTVIIRSITVVLMYDIYTLQIVLFLEIIV